MAVEITVVTTKYSAQELQGILKLAVVLGGDNPDEYIIIVDELMVGVTRGVLTHLGIEKKQ